ncbi:hypothetical protein CPB84DRAFT_1750992 [Gymnopilus junonius]|uniref:Uncharacterized protein n=1 Tax=Gymnopilus junonius TaxID=109634 RepID=A0A9P5NCM9_GYMJU|nr:hypothetical protein CPB84DRAFT_1750992 [Gymnopilus junonius]
MGEVWNMGVMSLSMNISTSNMVKIVHWKSSMILIDVLQYAGLRCSSEGERFSSSGLVMIRKAFDEGEMEEEGNDEVMSDGELGRPEDEKDQRSDCEWAFHGRCWTREQTTRAFIHYFWGLHWRGIYPKDLLNFRKNLENRVNFSECTTNAFIAILPGMNGMMIAWVHLLFSFMDDASNEDGQAVPCALRPIVLLWSQKGNKDSPEEIGHQKGCNGDQRCVTKEGWKSTFSQCFNGPKGSWEEWWMTKPTITELKKGMAVLLWREPEEMIGEITSLEGELQRLQIVDEDWAQFFLLVPIKWVQLGLFNRLQYWAHYHHWPNESPKLKPFPINSLSLEGALYPSNDHRKTSSIGFSHFEDKEE